MAQPISFHSSFHAARYISCSLLLKATTIKVSSTITHSFLRRKLPDKTAQINFLSPQTPTNAIPLKFSVIQFFRTLSLDLFLFLFRLIYYTANISFVFPPRPPRIVLTFQKQYVSLRFLDQYFSALATNISAKTILGGGILQFPAGPKSSEPIFVGFSTASHQRGQNVAAWQEMKVQVAASTNTNTDTNTLTN